MHVTILSRSSAIYTTRRIADAARVAGHKVRVIDPLRCTMFVDGASATLLYRGRPVPRTDACIPRIGQSVQHYGLTILDQFSQRGIPVLNGASAISRTRNQMRLLQHLASHGVPVPPTVMAQSAAELREMIGKLGGCPVILKLLHGRDRTGVMVCETPQSLEAALEALMRLGHHVIAQRYVRDPRGRDLRILVVGGRAVAAVRRQTRAGRLRRTLGAGARFEAEPLRGKYVEIAEEVARLAELEVAAVDMIEVGEGPKVFEVNSSPGLQEIEDATGIDAAAAIVARAVTLAAEARVNRKRPSAGRTERAATQNPRSGGR